MMSIGAFSKISNVTTKTLRYYDEIGLLKPVYVNINNNYRYYDVSQLKTVLLISKLKLYGFSLEEIAAVIQTPCDNGALLMLIKQKRQSIFQQIKHFEHVLSRLNEEIKNLERGIHLMSYLDEINVQLIETQPKNILSIRKRINVADYGLHIRALFSDIEKANLTPVGAPMSIFHDEAYDPENYDIEIAVPVKENTGQTRTLSGNLCAMVTLKGPYNNLPSVYARLQEWVEANGYQITSPFYEIYLTDPGQTPPEENITEVYLPVAKR
jgi:DNA-binding transcriptional MerR regulator